MITYDEYVYTSKHNSMISFSQNWWIRYSGPNVGHHLSDLNSLIIVSGSANEGMLEVVLMLVLLSTWKHLHVPYNLTPWFNGSKSSNDLGGVRAAHKRVCVVSSCEGDPADVDGCSKWWHLNFMWKKQSIHAPFSQPWILTFFCVWKSGKLDTYCRVESVKPYTVKTVL